ncbi:MAG TPA: thiamine phosphate synthase [Vicinamibacterales bacterium]|nr:thiamine phosphate synthase [Vicinamibacterales bacterium]
MALQGLPALYPILDNDVCAIRRLDPLALAAAWFRAGVGLLQLRHKEGPDHTFLGLSDTLTGLAHASGARLIVNDRADIALMSNADGVHVGQHDLPVSELRALVGPLATIGVSCHDPEQVNRALESAADYVAVGPIFATTTKEIGYDARGLDLVRYAAGRGKPVVAIGGITLDTAAGVIRAGATAVAVISDLLAGNPEARIRQYLHVLS